MILRLNSIPRSLDFLKTDDVIASTSTPQQKMMTEKKLTDAKNKALTAERSLQLEELRAKIMENRHQQLSLDDNFSMDSGKSQGNASKHQSSSE